MVVRNRQRLEACLTVNLRLKALHEKPMSQSPIYDKLQALGITLPPLAAPAAAYLPFVETGKLVFLGGHIAKKNGKPWVGQVSMPAKPRRGLLSTSSLDLRIAVSSPHVYTSLRCIFATCLVASPVVRSSANITLLVSNPFAMATFTSRKTTWRQ